MYPPLSPRTVEPRTQAYLALCGEHRESARQAWEKKDFKGARDALDALLSLLPGLPDRALIEQILSSEIQELERRIRERDPDGDLAALQAQTAAARDVARSYGDLCPSTSSESRNVQASPPDVRLKSACRSAWERQMERFLAHADFENATLLLQMNDWSWFGKQEETNSLRRKVFRAKTEAHRREAERALKDDRKEDGRRHMEMALESALEADDAALVGQCEVLLALLYPAVAGPDCSELREALARGDYAGVIERAGEELANARGSVELRVLRSTAIRRLLTSGEAAARAGDWDTSLREARLVLKHEPSSLQARELERTALNGKREREGDRRRAEAYDEAWQSFLDARSEQRPVAAFESYLRMRALEPGSPRTADALGWLLPAIVGHLRNELEANPVAETVERLWPTVRKLLSIAPEYAPLIEFQEQLSRASRGSEREQLLKSANLLRRAEKACNDLDPVEALNLVRQLEELYGAANDHVCPPPSARRGENHRLVVFRIVLSDQARVFDVARDADDLAPLAVHARTNTFAERILVREHAARQGLAQDDCARAGQAVLFAKRASAKDRDAQHGEVAGRHLSPDYHSASARAPCIWPALNGYARVNRHHASSAGGNRVGESHRRRSRQACQPGLQSFQEGALLRRLWVAMGVETQRHGHHALRTHAQPHILQFPKALQQEAGRCKQHQRYRKLTCYQQVPQTFRAPARHPPAGEGFHARSLKRRGKTE